MGFGDMFTSESATKTSTATYNVAATEGSVAFVNRGGITVAPGGSYYRGKNINLSVTGAPPSSSGTYLANAIEGAGVSPVTGLPAPPGSGDGKKSIIAAIGVAIVLFVVLFLVTRRK